MKEGTIPEVVPFDATLDVPIDDQKYVEVALLDLDNIGKLNFGAAISLHLLGCFFVFRVDAMKKIQKLLRSKFLEQAVGLIRAAR